EMIGAAPVKELPVAVDTRPEGKPFALSERQCGVASAPCGQIGVDAGPTLPGIGGPGSAPDPVEAGTVLERIPDTGGAASDGNGHGQQGQKQDLQHWRSAERATLNRLTRVAQSGQIGRSWRCID